MESLKKTMNKLGFIDFHNFENVSNNFNIKRIIFILLSLDTLFKVINMKSYFQNQKTLKKF
jgi:hypothetical protein